MEQEPEGGLEWEEWEGDWWAWDSEQSCWQCWGYRNWWEAAAVGNILQQPLHLQEEEEAQSPSDSLVKQIQVASNAQVDVDMLAEAVEAEVFFFSLAMFVWQACDLFEDMETEAGCRALFAFVAKQCAGVREEGSPSSGVTAAMQQKVGADEGVA